MSSVDENRGETGAAELLPGSSAVETDWLAGQLRARQMWLGVMVPGQGMQREAKLVDSTKRAWGLPMPLQGTAHAAGTPTLLCMPHPHPLACLCLLHVLCVTAGFPLCPTPSSDKDHCLSPA